MSLHGSQPLSLYDSSSWEQLIVSPEKHFEQISRGCFASVLDRAPAHPHAKCVRHLWPDGIGGDSAR